MQELIYQPRYTDEHLINTQPAFIAYNTFKMHGRHGWPEPHNPNG